LWEAVREIVASGRIGDLRAVQSWFSYFNDDPTNIRNVAASGGGALYDVGCYTVNLSRMLFGAEPVRVQGPSTATRSWASTC
jgi:predicted dehydrogenase